MWGWLGDFTFLGWTTMHRGMIYIYVIFPVPPIIYTHVHYIRPAQVWSFMLVSLFALPMQISAFVNDRNEV